MQAYEEQALAYLKGEMSSDERSAFEEMLARSEDVREVLGRSRALLELLEAASEKSIAQRVDRIVRDAVENRASDIHVVPGSDGTVVQLRVDGALHEVERVPKEMHNAFVDRWKAMGACNVSERSFPQDGRFALTLGADEYDLRINITPTVRGERVTVRILARQNVLLGLDRLGMRAPQLDAMRRLATRGNGLVITAGATNSGKTTLLYSMLIQCRDAANAAGTPRNIMTIEDPVECLIEGTSQTAVNRKAGVLFTNALRSFMRSDPDVIMVGEIRDLETAELIAQATITGHLLLSVLHVGNAAAIPARLAEIGLAPFLIAQALAGLISQRLIRKLCPECSVEYSPGAGELEKAGLLAEDGPFRRGSGCPACGGRGYRGRMGICEVVEVDEPLRRMIAEGAETEEIWRYSFRDGGSLRHQARELVRQGSTTVEEMGRVLFDYPRLTPARSAPIVAPG